MELSSLSWPAIDALPRDTPVVLPIAALEQHGHHLPVFTDSLQLAEIVRRVEQTLAEQVLFAPVMWLGNSEHHLDFPGSMSASPRVYLDLLRDMIECFLRHGFSRIVLLNGHGGNRVPGQQVLYEIRQKYRERDDLLLLLASYWSLGKTDSKAVPGLTQPQILHACQWETSMMLRLRPDLVGDISSLEPIEYGIPFEPAHRSSIMRDFSAVGHVGAPRDGTAEIGETLFTIFAADVVAFLQRVLDWDGRSWNG